MIENIRLYWRTARKHSLGVCLSAPQSCETGNPYGKSFRTSKRPEQERICAGVRFLCGGPGVKARTHQRMGVDFPRKDGPAEVVSEQGRRLTVLFVFVAPVPQRGMKGEDWPTRAKLWTALGLT